MPRKTQLVGDRYNNALATLIRVNQQVLADPRLKADFKRRGIKLATIIETRFATTVIARRRRPKRDRTKPKDASRARREVHRNGSPAQAPAGPVAPG
jgi:hypothetical protein